MKSKIYLIFIAVLTIVGCSNNDDNSVPNEDYGKLTLQLEQKNVTVGESVTFKVTNSKKEAVNSNIFIDGIPALANHTFKEEGTFNVVAKRNGYLDSNVLKVEVAAKRLVLKADKVKVDLSDYVEFSVLYNNKAVNDVVIYNTKTNEPLNSTYFVPTEIGVYSFVAKADGYSDSAEIVIEVNEPANKFTVNGYTFKIDDFILVMSRVSHIDIDGNETVQDEVRELPDGRLANVYYFLLGKQTAESWDMVFVDFLVPNPTIIKKGDKIVDYGVRALPKVGSDIIGDGAYVTVGDQSFSIYSDEITEFSSVLKNLQIDKDGLFNDGYDYVEHDPNRYLNGVYNGELKMKSDYGSLEVLYDSTIRFYDKITYEIDENEPVSYKRAQQHKMSKSSNREEFLNLLKGRK